MSGPRAEAHGASNEGKRDAARALGRQHSGLNDPRSLLMKTKCTHLAHISRRQQMIVWLPDHATISHTMKTMALHRILSVPVYAKHAEEEGELMEPLGFVDLHDILAGFMAFIQDGDGFDADMPMLKKMSILESKGSLFSHTLLKDLPSIGKDGDLLFQGIAERCTLWELVHDGFMHPRRSGEGEYEGEASSGKTQSVPGAPLGVRGRSSADGSTDPSARTQRNTGSASEAADDGRTSSLPSRDGSATAACPPAKAGSRALPAASQSMRGSMHTPARCVHRVGVFNTSGVVQAVISQTDVVRFLHENMRQLGPIARMTVGEAGWVRESRRDLIVKITPETLTLDALSKMNRLGLAGLPVVDEQGLLLGNISMSDFRCITPEHFGALALPVGEFLALEHSATYLGYARGPSPPASPDMRKPRAPEPAGSGAEHVPAPLRAPGKASSQAAWLQRELCIRAAKNQTRQRDETPTSPTAAAIKSPPGSLVGQSLVVVRPHHSVQEVMGRLLRARLHRTYVVDDDLKLLGVVTLSDILRFVIEI